MRKLYSQNLGDDVDNTQDTSNTDQTPEEKGTVRFFKKKSLGQNFLKSEKALAQIIEAGDLKAGDNILEIGPGEGALTKKLLKNMAILGSGHLTVIEKDDRLIPILGATFEKELKSGVLNILHMDILEAFESGEIAKNPFFSKDFKVIANIPYYITGAILRNLFELPVQPTKAVLLVQKEVADRIVANDHKESLLSVSVKFYGTPRRVAVVPKGAFSPAPSVDSAIICVDAIQKRDKALESAFFAVAKSAFAHKRKLLIKNIENYEIYLNKNADKQALGQVTTLKSHQKTDWRDIFTKENIPLNARAEDISTEQYIALAKHLL